MNKDFEEIVCLALQLAAARQYYELHPDKADAMWTQDMYTDLLHEALDKWGK
ncbi:hypothetical protein [Nocardia grenadensis]|uniref:hypothetical protein n=1 Tax=Nocardia grenadensis TaxID=931537 RepID=UPI003D75D947